MHKRWTDKKERACEMTRYERVQYNVLNCVHDGKEGPFNACVVA